MFWVFIRTISQCVYCVYYADVRVPNHLEEKMCDECGILSEEMVNENVDLAGE